MTLKSAAKQSASQRTVIFGDPKMPAQEKEQLIRAFAMSVDLLNCKLVIQGANIPTTPQAEKRMLERDRQRARFHC